MSLPAKTLAFLVALSLSTLPAAAQTGNPGQGQTGTPPAVDDDEAGDANIVPLRIGPVTLSGSAWLDSKFVTGNEGREENAFRVGRARLGLAGNVTPKIGWSLSGELTADSSVLRNAFLVFRFAEQFNVRMGQAAPPTALERGTSPLLIELIDRSRLTNQLTFRQDVGITVSNAAPFKQWVSYAISVVNGAGLNRPDDNNAKDVAVRLEVTPPALQGLTFNLSGGTGEQPGGRRTRTGAGVEYDSVRFRLMVEGLRQQADGAADRHGVVAIGVYRIRPRVVTTHFRLLELAARYVVFTDPAAALATPAGPDEDGADSSVSGVPPRTTREIQAGGNYYVNRNVRVMANIVMPLDARTTPDLTLLTRLQIVF